MKILKFLEKKFWKIIKKFKNLWKYDKNHIYDNKNHF